MKKGIIILCCLLSSFIAFSQTDSLKNEIANYENSRGNLISKARNLLLNTFVKGDTAKTKKIVNYMINELDDNDYLALYPSEKFLIYCWTEEYTKALNEVMAATSDNFHSGKILPNNDLLLKKLEFEIERNWFFFVFNIENSSVSEEERDFLILALQSILRENYVAGSGFYTGQDTINKNATKFIENYPNSKYVGFVRNSIRYEYVQRNWGGGVELFTGYGILTDDLSDRYTNPIPFGVAFDVYYKNFVLYLRDYIGISQVKNDIPMTDGVLEKGESQSIIIPEASLGYNIWNKSRLRVTPFLGIAGTMTGPFSDIEQKYKETELSGLTYVFGVNLDVKLGKKTFTYYYSDSPAFLRIRYSFNMPQFDISGNMHSFTVGIGIGGRGVKRKL